MGAWLDAAGLGWLLVGLPWVAATVLGWGNIDTVIGTWRGREGSSPVTWTMWAVLGAVALVSQLAVGGWTAAAILLVPITAVATAVAAGAWLRYRDAQPGLPWQWKVDLGCSLGTLAALTVLLAVDGKPALVLAVVTDLIAAVPAATMALWPDPGRPMTPRPFITLVVAASCTMLAAPPDFWQLLYPLGQLVLGLTMIALIVIGRPRADIPPVDEDPLRLTPARPLRPPPEHWMEWTTDRRRPPWRHNPHALDLARLVPPDLLDPHDGPGGGVPLRRVVDLMQATFEAGHAKGWRGGWQACQHLNGAPPCAPGARATVDRQAR
jgi:hypothetical protein